MKVNSFSATALFGVMVLFGVFHLGICREDPYIRMRLGGNDDEIESLARFAVQEHNRKENGLLEFTRVLKAREQVVAGKLYHLTLEAIDAGMKKVYEAKVWVKPWMKFKQLQEFKHAHYDPSFTTSDLGVKPDGHMPRWESVSIHDPEVLDAANHAITSIQERSNSLSPYKLLEILLARAKVIEDSAVFDLLLKVTRGVKVEKFKVNLNKSINGKFYLNQIEQDPS